MFAAAKKMILPVERQAEPLARLVLVARLEDVDVDPGRDVVHGEAVQQRARRDDVRHPARRHDEVQARALVDAVLEAVEERGPCRGAGAGTRRGTGTSRSRGASARSRASTRRGRSAPTGRAAATPLVAGARSRGKRGEAEVRAVQVVQLHDRRGAEPRVGEHAERRRVEDVLEAEQVEELARRAVERAPEQVSFQRADVGVRESPSARRACARRARGR